MTGSFAAVYNAFAIKAQPGSGSSAYLEFTGFTSFQNEFYNMDQVTFWEGTDLTVIKLAAYNSNIYIDGLVTQQHTFMTDSITTQNSVIWLNGRIRGYFYDYNYLLYLEPEDKPNVVVINDSVAEQQTEFGLYNFDITKNSYVAFHSEIMSITYTPQGFPQGIIGTLTAKTANGVTSFYINNNKYPPPTYTVDNFVIEPLPVNYNGTNTIVYGIKFINETDIYSQPAEFTVTMNKGNMLETDVVSFFPTVGSDGKTHTGSTTYILSDNSISMSKSATPLLATTLLETDTVSDNQTIHEVVIASGYTDSDGHIASSTWTELTLDMVDADPVYLSSSMVSSMNGSTSSDHESYLQPSESTAYITKDSTTETDVVSFFPTVGSDGKTHTDSTTYILSDNSTFLQYHPTTAILFQDGNAETIVISYYPKVGSDGTTHTASSAYTMSQGAMSINGVTTSYPSSDLTSGSNSVSSGSDTVTFRSGTSIQGSNLGTQSTGSVTNFSSATHTSAKSIQYKAVGSISNNNVWFAVVLLLISIVQ
ncbi:hypothetical protein RNJ44_02958 [Nakaseomyces bracarensis]|uniref:Uncharacterized protein n=1 Tax=Nakaseomyces bracarensis TaxID=273131 RepID=A0ABR4P0T6_9SACH